MKEIINIKEFPCLVVSKIVSNRQFSILSLV